MGTHRGRIAFVGAGPGVPSLLTLAAVDMLESADKIVLTHEEQRGLLTALDLHGSVEQVAEGESLLTHLLDDALVAVLVDGDPLMDARATRIARECSQAGYDIDVVPGIPRKTSMPEFAGVSLSDGQVQLITLHDDVDEHSHWAPSGTLVVIGAAAQMPEVQRIALASERAADEPALVTVRAGSTSQRSRSTTVGRIAETVAGMKVAATTTVVVVIGRQAGELERAQLDWFETKPLFGWKVLVPRTQDQAGPLVRRLATFGADTQLVPTIAVEEPRTPQQMDRAVQGIVEGRYQWVAFTSANAVRALREKATAWGLDARVFSGLRLAAVGPATAEALLDWGLRVDLMPTDDQSAAGLAAEFPAFDELFDPINRVLVPKADIATDALAHGLADLGWEVEDVIAYRTVRAAPPPLETREMIKTGQFDAVVFTSSSTVRNLVGIAGKPHNASVIAAIGPQTARTCREHGLRVDVQAEHPSALELADALARFAEERRDELAAKGKPNVRPSLKPRRGRQPAALKRLRESQEDT
ncbi:uroporphyrinogen-III synthase [Aestuariimicrobium soli]|uniref:uroporphyrinogen-III synthase n=1 Tax=Aestuariimicrobium soli TaxID=2035834 RepID=UPI003EBEAFF6